MCSSERARGPVHSLSPVVSGRFSTAGVQALGVKEDGVGWALDDNNKPLITPEIQAAVDKAKADIIAGTVKVHDYMSDNSCPK